MRTRVGSGDRTVDGRPDRFGSAPAHFPTTLGPALAFLGFLTALLIAVGFGTLPAGSSTLTSMLLHTPAVLAFGSAGLVAWHRRPHNAGGRLMFALAIGVWLSGLTAAESPVLRAAAGILGSLSMAVVMQLLLSFPSGRLSGRSATTLVTLGYLAAAGVPTSRRLLPGWPGVAFALVGVGVGALLGSGAVLLRRARSVESPFRREYSVVAYAGWGLMVILTGTVVVLNSDRRPVVGVLTGVVQLAALTALAGVLLAGLLSGRYGRAGEIEEFARSIDAASTDAAELDAALVRSLGDPTGRVLYADGGGYLDAEGNRAPVVPVEGRRRWILRHGERVHGVIEYDAHLLAESTLMATVAPSVMVAMERRRLLVDLQGAVLRLQQSARALADSRRRILASADAERRRISRDLHDGAQQKIVALGIQSQRIGRRPGDPEFVRAAADDLTSGLTTLLDDLRRLVHGLAPAALAEHGLAAAVRGAVAELPIEANVQVDLGTTELPADIESAAYFVVMEAATNVVKHAAATDLSIGILAADDRLILSIGDNGSGGGPSAAGFGLLSLRDRVDALGGRLTIEPGIPTGTIVRAEIPCA